MQPRGRVPAPELFGLALLTSAALALRLLHLTRFDLWVDEAATWWFSRLTAAGELTLRLEPTPPLYYGLLGVLMRLFGESDLVLRLPSALIGAATVPAVYALGRTLFTPAVGGFAAVLLAVHPLHVFYSREARVYPLLLLLTVLALTRLWRALESNRWRDWLVCGALLLLACYSHFYGLFVVGAAGLVVLLWRRPGGGRARGLVTLLAVGIGFSPYLVLTLPHLRQSGAAWSVEQFYRDFPEEKRFGRPLEMSLIGAGYHPHLRYLAQPPTPLPLRLLSLLAQAGLLVLALLRGLRSRAKMQAITFLVIAWLVPLALPWLVTHVGGRALYLPGRHDVYVLGPVCVLLGLGIATLFAPAEPGGWPASRRRTLAAGLLLLLAASAVHRLVWMHRIEPAHEARDAGRWIADHARPEDRVIAFGIRRLVAEHYARLAGSAVPFQSFPRSTDAHPGWADPWTLAADPARLADDAAATVAALDAAPPPTVFLLHRQIEQGPRVSVQWAIDHHLFTHLERAGWQPVPELSSPPLEIAAFQRAPPGDVE